MPLTDGDERSTVRVAEEPHLFERFVRADKARSGELGSTGLGPTIVASIVDAHRGSASMESGEGATVFRVRLPVVGPAR